MHPAYGVCLLLVLAVLMVYGQVKDHEFLALDDPDYVSDNQQVKLSGPEPLSLEVIEVG